MRNTKLSMERKEVIIDAIKQGNTKETAAKLAGISEKTLYNWLARGRDEEPPEGLEEMKTKDLRDMAKGYKIKGYSRMKRDPLIVEIENHATIYRVFLEEMEQAEAQGLAEHVRNVKNAGLEDWRASAWFLERRDPDNWGRRERLQLDNKHSGSIKTEHHEKSQYEIEVKLSQDPELQELYMKIWERQQLVGIDEE